MAISFASPETSLVAFVALSLAQAVVFMLAPEVLPAPCVHACIVRRAARPTLRTRSRKQLHLSLSLLPQTLFCSYLLHSRLALTTRPSCTFA